MSPTYLTPNVIMSPLLSLFKFYISTNLLLFSYTTKTIISTTNRCKFLLVFAFEEFLGFSSLCVCSGVCV